MKTIKMPQETLDKWLAALRSGEYKQAAGRLRGPCGGYCCLGVLQHVLDGKVTPDKDADDELPPLDWLEEKDITFFVGSGIEGRQPYLPTLDCYAAEANDETEGPHEDGCAVHTYNFNQIADAIEQTAEGF